MNLKSQVFQTAHKITKSVIQSGDSYQITFGAALKVARQFQYIVGEEIRYGTGKLIDRLPESWIGEDICYVYEG